MEKKKISVLKRERFLRGIKQVDLAAETGIVYSKLSMFENGHRVPTDEEKKKIAKAMGVSVKVIFPEGK